MNGKKRSIGFSFAWNGLMKVLRTERNFQIQLMIMLIVIIAGFYFHIPTVEWAIIILTIGLVLATEVINSVVEQLIDYLKPEIHPKAKIIKDISAGSVLVASIVALVIGLIIFIPKIYILI